MKFGSKRTVAALRTKQTVHVRFRMYKAKKRWLIAGTALLLMPALFQPGRRFTLTANPHKRQPLPVSPVLQQKRLQKQRLVTHSQPAQQRKIQRLLQVVRLSTLLVLQLSHLHQASLVQL